MGLGDETAETHHRVQGPAARLIGGRASHFLEESDTGAWRGGGVEGTDYRDGHLVCVKPARCEQREVGRG